MLSILSMLPFHFAQANSGIQNFDESQSFVTPPASPQSLEFSLFGGPRRYVYETSFINAGNQVVSLLQATPNDDFTTLDPAKKVQCERRYQTVLNDQKIDIRIAMGYMDWSTGGSISYEGTNFGKSPSNDLGGYRAMERFLLASCQGNLQVCGFQKSTQEAGLYTKTVSIRGRTYPVELRMRQPSLTESYDTNMQRSAEQTAKSAETRNFYIQALQNADMAIYFGHSRNGGGPDFNPPILLGNGHPDYNGYYLPKQIGAKMVTSALAQSGHQTPIMSLMSCDSQEHFFNKINAVAPSTGVISTTRIVIFEHLFAATLSEVDSLLRGQCQKSFYQAIRTAPATDDITMDHMFE